MYFPIRERGFNARRVYATHIHSAECYGPVSVCLSVCLSVTRQRPVQIAELIELVFDIDATFGLSLCYKRIRVSPK